VSVPLFREKRSRKLWRREVAAHLADRVDANGFVRFVGRNADSRKEMLKVAELLPADLLVEVYEDLRYPDCVFLEVRREAAPPKVDPGFRLVPGDTPTGEYPRVFDHHDAELLDEEAV
jgi:hypothetical protein